MASFGSLILAYIIDHFGLCWSVAIKQDHNDVHEKDHSSIHTSVSLHMVLSHSTLTSSLVLKKKHNFHLLSCTCTVKTVDFDVWSSVLETVHFISISALKFMCMICLYISKDVQEKCSLSRAEVIVV